VWSIAADTYETLYLNPAAERIYGRTASAFYADPQLFMNIVHPEDRPRVAQLLPELIEKGTMAIQYRVVRPDGEVRWLEDNTAIARDADGRPVRFDGVASDITERRRASKASNLGASPAAIVCFDILSLFGDSEVTSQVDRLNSSDTYRVE
jgi:PAS domain S-box-containing protein